MPLVLVIGGLILFIVALFALATLEQEMPSIKKAIAKMFQSRSELRKAKYELARRKLEIEHEERMAAWRGIDNEPEPIKGAPPVSVKPVKFDNDDEEQVVA